MRWVLRSPYTSFLERVACSHYDTAHLCCILLLERGHEAVDTATLLLDDF